MPPVVARAPIQAGSSALAAVQSVALMLDQEDIFPDNWIYIHDPNVLVGRIQNYKNWSPDMVPDPEKSGIGMEYFCNEGDELWSTPDSELIEMAAAELVRIGIAPEGCVEDGCVFRMAKAYPVYDSAYGDHLERIREFVSGFENLQTIIELIPDEQRHRVGVCFDTCHAFSAGYDLVDDYDGVWSAFDEIIGLDRLGLLHLNDSQHPFDSRKDRHEGIGEGSLGTEPFRRIVLDERLMSVPKVLETPKGDDGAEADIRNLTLLRTLRIEG